MQNYKDLGWQNNWKEAPLEYKECLNLKHVREDYSKSNRGYEHIVTCDICKIVYRYDSSD